MTSFKKVLMPVSGTLKKTSRVTVAIRVSHHGKSGYISTGVNVGCSPSSCGKMLPRWTDGMVTSAEPEWISKNRAAEDFLVAVRARYERIAAPGLMTCAELCRTLREEAPACMPADATVRSALADYLEQRRQDVSANYCRMVVHSVERLCAWAGKDIPLRDISPELLRLYQRHLAALKRETVQKEAYFSQKYKQVRYRRKTVTGKALSAASVGKELSHVKAVVNYAVSADLVRYPSDPFSSVVIGRSRARETDVAPEIIRKIRDAVLDSPGQSLARDTFMLSFYLGGMNYKDMLAADFSGDIVVYCRAKTRTLTAVRQTVKVPVLPEAREILDRRTKKGRWCSGLKFSDSRDEIGYIGKHLRKMAEALGLPPCTTFYSARKSFGQYALEIGISDTVTDYLMGHSDSRRGVISYYSRVTPRMAGLALRKVADYMSEPEKYLEAIERAILA